MEGINLNQIGVSFKGSGSYVPNQILTNQDISEKVDTSDEWIKSRTGISQRRISGLEEDVSQMGYEAALAAIKMTNWDIDTIDLIILATSTPNDLFGSAFLKSNLLRIKKRLDHAEHGGALLLGVNGICVIGHGSSKSLSVVSALRLAHSAVNHNVMENLNQLQNLQVLNS